MPSRMLIAPPTIIITAPKVTMGRWVLSSMPRSSARARARASSDTDDAAPPARQEAGRAPAERNHRRDPAPGPDHPVSDHPRGADDRRRAPASLPRHDESALD